MQQLVILVKFFSNATIDEHTCSTVDTYEIVPAGGRVTMSTCTLLWGRKFFEEINHTQSNFPPYILDLPVVLPMGTDCFLVCAHLVSRCQQNSSMTFFACFSLWRFPECIWPLWCAIFILVSSSIAAKQRLSVEWPSSCMSCMYLEKTISRHLQSRNIIRVFWSKLAIADSFHEGESGGHRGSICTYNETKLKK